MATPVSGEADFLFYVMFWTILAMMLVLIYSLKQVIVTQRYIENIDKNIEKMAKKTLMEEERILSDIEEQQSTSKRHSSKSSGKQKK